MKRTIDIHIGKKVKFLREAKDLSQSDLEIAANLESGSIARFEDGLVAIKSNEILHISEVLQTTIGFFYQDNVIEDQTINERKSNQMKVDTSHHGRN